MYLQLTDFNIEQAMQLYFENGGAPLTDDPVPSTSGSRQAGYEDESGVVHVDSDDDVTVDESRSAHRSQPAQGSNFEEEDETVYMDFLKMPPRKVRNASQSFLFAEPDERIFFICDQSILGSCKEGFAMTDQALYWRMPLQKAERVYYEKIETVLREKRWITVNDMFFNVNPTLNLKMLKLLKKLKRLFVVV